LADIHRLGITFSTLKMAKIFVTIAFIELLAMAFHSRHPTHVTQSADPDVASHL
jgi:hypothetical protein